MALRCLSAVCLCALFRRHGETIQYAPNMRLTVCPMETLP